MAKNLSKIEAVNLLSKFDHSFLTPETVESICKPFALPCPLYKARDNRSQFKGLTLHGINPVTGKDFQEGDYAEGQDAHKLAEFICEKLGLSVPDMFGIGSRLQVACDALRKHLQ